MGRGSFLRVRHHSTLTLSGSHGFRYSICSINRAKQPPTRRFPALASHAPYIGTLLNMQWNKVEDVWDDTALTFQEPFWKAEERPGRSPIRSLSCLEPPSFPPKRVSHESGKVLTMRIAVPRINCCIAPSSDAGLKSCVWLHLRF